MEVAQSIKQAAAPLKQPVYSVTSGQVKLGEKLSQRV
eukprot:CAMPEP_0177766248 /NCGR_PEP_ID=MMETSP0491_2-20121128/8428_1 /TAXON_ID=63592 /ORGANISM="Tetraselmis chuii, Strain PLY429" /LENGTH=36 /DNA_ID= /DNA_START= /DNA_END= /DNA_ORIENTATION=